MKDYKKINGKDELEFICPESMKKKWANPGIVILNKTKIKYGGTPYEYEDEENDLMGPS